MELRLPDDIGRELAGCHGKEVFFGIRPEHIGSRQANPEAMDNFVRTEVLVVENMGNEAYVYFTPGKNQYIARVDPGIQVRPGDLHDMWFDPRHVHLFDRKTASTLIHPPKTA